MSRMARFALLGLSLATAACGTVQPWERGELARPTMAWDPDPLRASLSAHVHDSKEASSGRIGLAGGGCGCN